MRRKAETKPGHTWKCHDCIQLRTKDINDAIAHADTTHHWVYEYPDAGGKLARELHGSDAGGVYLTAVGEHNFFPPKVPL